MKGRNVESKLNVLKDKNISSLYWFLRSEMRKIEVVKRFLILYYEVIVVILWIFVIYVSLCVCILYQLLIYNSFGP